MVCARMERETRDVFLVAFKIAEVGIVVGGEVADCIVYFGTGMNDTARSMSEHGIAGTVFQTQTCFLMLTFFDIIDLHGIIGF